MTQTDTTRPLDYAPPPPLHRRRRFRLALYAIILIGLFPAFVHFTPMAVNHLRLLYWQREVRQHEPPPRQTILKLSLIHI